MYREQLMQQKKNKVASLYPICKMEIMALYVVLIVLANIIKIRDLSLLLIPLSLGVLILFGISGQIRDYFSFLKVIAVLFIFMFLIQALLIKGTEPVLLWQWGIFKIHREGLQKAITLSFNIVNVAGIFFWLFRTSGYQEVSTALQQSGMSHKSAYIFLATFTMIEVLRKNVSKIMDAQTARGVETQANVLVRAKALIPVIVPLVVNAFNEVGERALTLESKAFSVPCRKTILIPVRKNGYETIALIVMSIIVLLAIGGTVVWLRR